MTHGERGKANIGACDQGAAAGKGACLPRTAEQHTVCSQHSLWRTEAGHFSLGFHCPLAKGCPEVIIPTSQPSQFQAQPAGRQTVSLRLEKALKQKQGIT